MKQPISSNSIALPDRYNKKDPKSEINLKTKSLTIAINTFCISGGMVFLIQRLLLLFKAYNIPVFNLAMSSITFK